MSLSVGQCSTCTEPLSQNSRMSHSSSLLGAARADSCWSSRESRRLLRSSLYACMCTMEGVSQPLSQPGLCGDAVALHPHMLHLIDDLCIMCSALAAISPCSSLGKQGNAHPSHARGPFSSLTHGTYCSSGLEARSSTGQAALKRRTHYAVEQSAGFNF